MKASGVKRIGIVITAILIIMCSALTITACMPSDSEPVKEISVDAETLKGYYAINDFNLGDIKLKVTYENGDTNTIAVEKSFLTKDGQNQLKTSGFKSITVFYKSKTTILEFYLADDSDSIISVRFNDKSGNELATVYGLKGGSVEAPKYPPVEGQSFIGWIDVQTGKPFNLNKVESSATVTANYSATTIAYTIKFFDHKGKECKTMTKTAGSKLTANDVPGVNVTKDYPELESFTWSENFPVTVERDMTVSMVPVYKSFSVMFCYSIDGSSDLKYLPSEYNTRVQYGANVSLVYANAEAWFLKNGYIAKPASISDLSTAQNITKDVTFIFNVSDPYITIKVYRDEDMKDVCNNVSVKPGTKYKFPDQGNAATIPNKLFKHWKLVGGTDKDVFEQGKEWTVVQKFESTVLEFVPVYDDEKYTVTFKLNFTSIVDKFEQNNSYMIDYPVEFKAQDAITQVYIDNLLEDIKNNASEYEKLFGGNTVESDINLKATHGSYNKTTGEYNIGTSLGDIAFAGGFDSSIVLESTTKAGGEKIYITVSEPYYVLGLTEIFVVIGNETSGFEYETVIATVTVEDEEVETIVGFKITDFDRLNNPNVNIYIPDSHTETINGEEVTAPVIGLFANLSSRTIARIPSTLKEIGNNVFENSFIYGDVDLPVLETLGEGAFKGATLYGNLSFGSIVSLGESAFENATATDSIIIDLTAKEVAANEPANEPEEKAVLTEIPAYAFKNVKGVGKIVLPSTITSVGEYAFADCETVFLSTGSAETEGELKLENVTNIAANAFANTGFTSVILPAITEIKDNAFANASSLQNVTLATTSEEFTLNGAAFVGCTAVYSVNLGKGVKEITDIEVFGAMELLSEITVDSENKDYYAHDNVLYEIDNTTTYTLCYYPNNKLGEYTVTIPANCELVILPSAFDYATVATLNLSKFSSLVVSNGTTKGNVYSVIASEELAEKLETALDTIVFTSVGDAVVGYDADNELVYEIVTETVNEVEIKTISVVGGNRYAETITVPATIDGKPVTEIKDGAFANFKNLTALNVEATLNGWSETILDGCTSLVEFAVGGWQEGAILKVEDFAGNAWFDAHNIIYIGEKLVGYNNYAKDITGNPITVVKADEARVYFGTQIKADFFRILDDNYNNICNITEITIPSEIKNIGNKAFADCKSLKKVVFEGEISTLGDGVFKGCSALKEMEITFAEGDNKSAAMGSGVFAECTSLKSVCIYGGVNYITAGAVDYYRLPVETFMNCGELETVVLEKINRFSQDASGGSRAFYGCSKLADFDFSLLKGDTIPAETFAGSGLRFIDFTQATSLKVIGASAFSGSQLEYVKFTANITRIGTGSFDPENLIVEIPYGNKTGLYSFADSVPDGAFSDTATFYYSKDIIDTSTNFLGNVSKKYSDYPVLAVDFLDDSIMDEGTVLQINIPQRKLFFTASDLTPPTYTGFSFAGWYLPDNIGAEFPLVLKSTGTVRLFAKYYKEKQGLVQSTDVDYVYYLGAAPKIITEKTTDTVTWFVQQNTLDEERVHQIHEWPFIVHTVLAEDKFNLYAIINGGTDAQEKIDFGDAGEKGYAIVNYTESNIVIPDVYDDEINGEDDVILIYAGAFKNDVNIKEFRLPSHTKAILTGYYEGASYTGGITFSGEMRSIIIPAEVEYIEDGVFTSNTLENITFEEGSRLLYATPAVFYGSAWWFEQFKIAESNNGFIKAGTLALQYVGKGNPIVMTEENVSGNDYIIRNAETYGFVRDENINEMTFGVGIYANEFLGNYDVKFIKQVDDVILWRGEVTVKGGVTVTIEFAFDADITVTGSYVGIEGNNIFKVNSELGIKALMIKSVNENDITVPGGIVKLNDRIFKGNKELLTVIVNKELVYVGDEAFAESGLIEVRYGETNTEQPQSVIEVLGNNVFNGTIWYEERENVIFGKIYLKYNNISGSENVTIRDNVTKIAYGAFKGVTVGTVDLASLLTLTSIEAYAFTESNISKIVLPKSVTEIGRGVFMNCINLNNADLSSVVIETLPQDMFRNATGLKSLLLNNAVKTFGKDSLSNCTSLASITATGITEVMGTGSGDNKFECGLESTAWYNNGNSDSEFLILGSVLLRYIEKPLEGPVDDEEAVKTITIPSGITQIAQYAFLSDLDERFSYTIEIGASVIVISDSAFAGKENIVEVKFANGLTTIGKRAFEGCKNLKTAILPESLERIEALAFAGTSLTTVVYDDYGIRAEDNGYTIPDNVIEIGERAFENVKTLTVLNLGSKLEMIGHKAFNAEDGDLYKVNWDLDIETPPIVDINVIPVSPADKLQQNIAAADDDNTKEYIPSLIFISSHPIRFYADSDVVLHVENNYKIWGPQSLTNNGGYNWNFYNIDDFPIVLFTNDNYNIQAFNSEYIKEGDIGLPVHDTDPRTTYTFMGWEVLDHDGYPHTFSYPYSVYEDITLSAKWYKNTAYPMLGGSVNTERITETSEISCDDGSKITEMSIDTSAGNVIINRILLGKADQKTLYLPSIVSNDNGSGSSSAVSYNVIGFSENLVITAPENDLGIDTNENRIGYIEELILTNATNFNGMTENIFASFKNLKKISLYTTSAKRTDYKIVPVEFTTEEEGRKTIHTFYTIYSNDKDEETEFGSKLIAFIGNINDAIPEGEDGEKLTGAEYEFMLEIPEGVTEICSKALINSGFKTIWLPSSITKIGNNAFGKDLSKLRISRNIYINDIGFDAFDIDSPIRTNPAKYISYSDFIEVESIRTSFAVGGSEYGQLYSVANVLLGYETGITQYNDFGLPDEISGFDITVIAEGIYIGKIINNGMGGYEKYKPDDSKIVTAYLTLPTNLIKINAHAFDDFDITTSVSYTGNSLTDMDGNVFGDCSFYTQSDGAMYLGKILVKWNDATGNVTVSPGTVSISSNAFNGSTATKITLPESLVFIADSAFYGSTDLREINIPNSVTQIGASAFQSCSALTTVSIDTVNSHLDSIGNNAFYKCKSLKQLRLPYNLTSIGDNAFSACSSLNMITFDGYREVITEQNTIEYVLENDKLSRLKSIGASAFSENTSLTGISIPNGVTVIRRSTFVSCTSLVNVKFDVTNSMLEKIEAQAFMGCVRLGSMLEFDAKEESSLSKVNPITLNLPNKLVVVEEQAFQNCSGLWGVQFNYNIREIGNNAFTGCDSLVKVNIFRSTVPTIYTNTFTPEGYKYRLRIYVNIGEDRAIVKKYEAAWPSLQGYIHEREDKPTVKFLDESNNVAHEIRGEIIISPSAIIDGATVLATELQFYRFEAYVYVAAVGAETVRVLQDVTQSAVGNRAGRRVSDYTTPYVQGDSAGYMHTDGKVYTIMVVDYETISLKKILA